MKLALNGATTMRADLVTDIRAARDAGFEFVEIWAAKLREYLKRHTLEELRELLASEGISAWSINSLEDITFRNTPDRASLLVECDELCAAARQIGCPYLVVVPSTLPAGTDESVVVEESVNTLLALGQIAERHGVALAFEFLGTPDCSVRTLETAVEIIDQVARPHIGLVVDTFHFFTGGSSIDTLERLDPGRVFIVHINDAEDRPAEELEDRHRLLPGLGILPLPRMLDALRHIGYDGAVSVEIFRPEYWQMDPFEFAREAYVAAANLIELPPLARARSPRSGR